MERTYLFSMLSGKFPTNNRIIYLDFLYNMLRFFTSNEIAKARIIKLIYKLNKISKINVEKPPFKNRFIF